MSLDYFLLNNNTYLSFLLDDYVHPDFGNKINVVTDILELWIKNEKLTDITEKIVDHIDIAMFLNVFKNINNNNTLLFNASKLILDNTNNLSQINDIIDNAINKILSETRAFIHSGWKNDETGHAVGLIIEENKKGQLFNVLILNSGDGIHYHTIKYDKNTNRNYVNICLKFNNVPIDILRHFLFCHMIMCYKSGNAEQYYEIGIDMLSEYLDKKFYLSYPEQLSGSCSLRSPLLMMYYAYVFSRGFEINANNNFILYEAIMKICVIDELLNNFIPVSNTTNVSKNIYYALYHVNNLTFETIKKYEYDNKCKQIYYDNKNRIIEYCKKINDSMYKKTFDDNNFDFKPLEYNFGFSLSNKTFITENFESKTDNMISELINKLNKANEINSIINILTLIYENTKKINLQLDTKTATNYAIKITERKLIDFYKLKKESNKNIINLDTYAFFNMYMSYNAMQNNSLIELCSTGIIKKIIFSLIYRWFFYAKYHISNKHEPKEKVKLCINIDTILNYNKKDRDDIIFILNEIKMDNSYLLKGNNDFNYNVTKLSKDDNDDNDDFNNYITNFMKMTDIDYENLTFDTKQKDLLRKIINPEIETMFKQLSSNEETTDKKKCI